MVIDRLGPIDHLTASRFSGDEPLTRLAFDFAMGLASALGGFEDATEHLLMVQALDLIAVNVAQRLNSEKVHPSLYRAVFLSRLKSFIKGHLRDPDLCLEVVAAAFAVTPRYVNFLLSADETSFGRHILHMRLEQCKRDLIDPARWQRQISDIAYSWGFKDAAHFSRAFKVHFGVSPSDLRHAAKLRKDPLK